jgi:hypothetical protein
MLWARHHDIERGARGGCDYGLRDGESTDTQPDRLGFARNAGGMQDPSKNEANAKDMHEVARRSEQLGKRNQQKSKRNIFSKIRMDADKPPECYVAFSVIGIQLPAQDANADAQINIAEAENCRVGGCDRWNEHQAIYLIQKVRASTGRGSRKTSTLTLRAGRRRRDAAVPPGNEMHVDVMNLLSSGGSDICPDIEPANRFIGT